ncbi:hypothetical protein ACJJIF_03825 [Microbulbifer sp. SSSA002]|uniref:hypothetical protein n=1 Tax=unclassified Microbulbifer TaxID=2619833 RepID=UPI00403A34A4
MKQEYITKPSTITSKSGWTCIPQLRCSISPRVGGGKRDDIVTYKISGKNEVYVLAKSGGVSLFDGISSKVQLGPKDTWWVITRNAKLEEGLIIAKDIRKDKEGNTHYSIEAERDMPISEYLEELESLKQYMKKVQ